ncbi:MAG: CBS domain-containing protein [Candidatus Nanohaloarchaea archaeon]|nr:CBS domain-containing protein [Candidatus Nanohaloarchaea archaeon]
MPAEPTAADVMTDGVLAIGMDASVQEAAEKMRDEGIRSLVVVEDDEAVGIVVGRDVLYQVAAEGRDPAGVTVEDVMTSNLITASEADNIEDIARAMIDNDISRVPILRGENLVGMVTQSNLIRTWPSYIELVQEENRVFGSEGPDQAQPPVEEQQASEGICDSCENYSGELEMVGGEMLCPECQEENLL